MTAPLRIREGEGGLLGASRRDVTGCHFLWVMGAGGVHSAGLRALPKLAILQER